MNKLARVTGGVHAALQVEALLEADREARMKASNLFEDEEVCTLNLKTSYVKPLPPRTAPAASRPGPASEAGPACDDSRDGNETPAKEAAAEAADAVDGDAPTKKRRKVIRADCFLRLAY